MICCGLSSLPLRETTPKALRSSAAKGTLLMLSQYCISLAHGSTSVLLQFNNTSLKCRGSKMTNWWKGGKWFPKQRKNADIMVLRTVKYSILTKYVKQGFSPEDILVNTASVISVSWFCSVLKTLKFYILVQLEFSSKWRIPGER